MKKIECHVSSMFSDEQSHIPEVMLHQPQVQRSSLDRQGVQAYLSTGIVISQTLLWLACAFSLFSAVEGSGQPD